jgi:peptidoglycan/LPS O-acetylase OafA/YrhL
MAACGVVVFHSISLFETLGYDFSKIQHFRSLLNSGVDLFFVLSGFVMFNSNILTSKSPISFLKGRIRRLLPLYLFLTTATFLIFNISQSLAFTNSQFSFSHYVTSITFTSHIFGFEKPIIQQGWTLEFEVIFYLIFALTLYFSNQKLRIFLSTVVIALLISFFPSKMFMIEFLLGIYVGAICHFKKPSKLLNSSLSYLAIFGLVLTPFCKSGYGLVLMYGFSYSLLIYWAVNRLNSKGSMRRTLGKMSYPLYLVHGLVIGIVYQFIDQNLNPTLEFVLLVCLGILIVSFLMSYYLLKFLDYPVSNWMIKQGW